MHLLLMFNNGLLTKVIFPRAQPYFYNNPPPLPVLVPGTGALYQVNLITHHGLCNYTASIISKTVRTFTAVTHKSNEKNQAF